MSDEPIDESKDRMKSAIGSLKEIVTIVSGVTITHAIIVLVSNNGAYLNERSLTEILYNPDYSLFYFLLLIFNIIRFYHGNMMHLDKTFLQDRAYSSTDGKQLNQRILGLDFIVIFIESVLFAIMSFYLHKPSEFFSLFILLLIIDVFWFLANFQQASQKEFNHQKIWAMLNFAAVIALLIIYGSSNKFTAANYYDYYILTLTIAATTVMDFYFNWGLYFPKIPENQKSRGGEKITETDRRI